MLENPQEEPASDGGNNNKKKKKNGGKKKNKGKDNAEPPKTQVYLPKPIRVKAMYLQRTDSNTFTFDSNSNSASGSTSQEKDESPVTKESNVVSEVVYGTNFSFGFSIL